MLEGKNVRFPSELSVSLSIKDELGAICSISSVIVHGSSGSRLAFNDDSMSNKTNNLQIIGSDS